MSFNFHFLKYNYITIIIKIIFYTFYPFHNGRKRLKSNRQYNGRKI